MSKSVDTETIIQLFNDYIPITQISKQTGYSKTTIIKHLKKYQIWENRSKKIDYQEILDRYVEQKQSIQKISKEMCISPTTVSKYLHEHNIPIQNNATKIDKTKLLELYNSGLLICDISTILGCSTDSVSQNLKKMNVPITNHITSKSDTVGKVLKLHNEGCKLIKIGSLCGIACGTVKKILIDHGVSQFKKKWNRSNDEDIKELYLSGTSSNEIAKLYGFCHTTILKHLDRLGIVKRRTSRREHQLLKSITNSIRSGAKYRNLVYELNEDYLYNLFFQQNCKCKLSGVEIALPSDYLEFSTGVHTASLDRIDSSKGYIKGNVQWVHKKVNIMKQDMSDSEFIEWCRTISRHNS
jgi:hypothetical protein